MQDEYPKVVNLHSTLGSALDVLNEAANIITGDRNKDYGPPENEFFRVSIGWTEILGIKVSPAQVVRMMIWLKIARDCYNPKRDNLVDIAGYAALGMSTGVYDTGVNNSDK